MAETVNLPSNTAPIANTGIGGGLKPQPVGGGTANQYVNGVRVTAGNQPSPVERKTEDTHADTILGMSKPLFFAGVGVIVLGIGFYMYKKRKA